MLFIIMLVSMVTDMLGMSRELPAPCFCISSTYKRIPEKTCKKCWISYKDLTTFFEGTNEISTRFSNALFSFYLLDPKIMLTSLDKWLLTIMNIWNQCKDDQWILASPWSESHSEYPHFHLSSNHDSYLSHEMIHFISHFADCHSNFSVMLSGFSHEKWSHVIWS